MPPQILTADEALQHTNQDDPQAQMYAENIAASIAQYVQWLNSRPHDEVVAAESEAVVQPPAETTSAPDEPATTDAATLGGSAESGADGPPPAETGGAVTEEEWRAQAQANGWTL